MISRTPGQLFILWRRCAAADGPAERPVSFSRSSSADRMRVIFVLTINGSSQSANIARVVGQRVWSVQVQRARDGQNLNNMRSSARRTTMYGCVLFSCMRARCPLTGPPLMSDLELRSECADFYSQAKNDVNNFLCTQSFQSHTSWRSVLLNSRGKKTLLNSKFLLLPVK